MPNIHEPACPAPRGTETVLLVEDATAVRVATRQVLTRYGYHVLTAESALEALALADAHEGVIHLLLTDVIMPQLTGPEVATRFLMLRPASRVLYMSGYPDDMIDRHGMLTPGIAYIAKPFSPSDLARKVREVLDAGI